MILNKTVAIPSKTGRDNQSTFKITIVIQTIRKYYVHFIKYRFICNKRISNCAGKCLNCNGIQVYL